MSNQRKVTFLSALPPFRGGIAQFSEQLLLSLVKMCKVQAFTFRHQYPTFLFPGQSQFEEQKPSFRFPRIVSTFRPWTYYSALRALKKSNGELFKWSNLARGKFLIVPWHFFYYSVEFHIVCR